MYVITNQIAKILAKYMKIREIMQELQKKYNFVKCCERQEMLRKYYNIKKSRKNHLVILNQPVYVDVFLNQPVHVDVFPMSR